MQALTDVISEVPEGSSAESKNFVGFYDEDSKLVAILDLITGYPESDDAFIGWFMVEAEKQGMGIGSQLFADIRAAMKAQGFDYLQVRLSKDSSDAVSFWQSQGFAATGEEDQSGRHTVLTFAREI